MSNETTPPVPGQGNPPAATPPASAPAVPPGNPQTDPGDWRPHIPQEFKDAPFWASVKDTKDLVTQFANTQRLIGAEKFPLPRDDWKPQDWDGLYNKLGRPDVAANYKPPVNAEGKPLVEGEDFKEIAAIAHKAGLTQRQFDTFLNEYAGVNGAAEQAEKKQTEAQLATFKEQLTKAHGDQLPVVLDKANRALTALGDKELSSLILGDPTLANHPALINLMARVSDLLGEDTMRTTGVVQSAHGSPALAANAIKQMESEHAALLFHRDPNTLPFAESQKRQQLLAERQRLYRTAYPNQ